MQYKFFKIPVKSIEVCEEEINRFLRSVKVVHLQRDWVDLGENSFWALAVEYLPVTPGTTRGAGSRKRPKVDYKEVLSDEDFAVFARLREWRKGVAAEEGVPVYTIFTNEQLAGIAEDKARSLADLGKIDGIGDARIAKYGDAVIRLVAAALPETPKKNGS